MYVTPVINQCATCASLGPPTERCSGASLPPCPRARCCCSPSSPRCWAPPPPSPRTAPGACTSCAASRSSATSPSAATPTSGSPAGGTSHCLAPRYHHTVQVVQEEAAAVLQAGGVRGGRGHGAQRAGLLLPAAPRPRLRPGRRGRAVQQPGVRGVRWPRPGPPRALCQRRRHVRTASSHNQCTDSRTK